MLRLFKTDFKLSFALLLMRHTTTHKNRSMLEILIHSYIYSYIPVSSIASKFFLCPLFGEWDDAPTFFLHPFWKPYVLLDHLQLNVRAICLKRSDLRKFDCSLNIRNTAAGVHLKVCPSYLMKSIDWPFFVTFSLATFFF